MVEVMKIMVTSFKRTHACTATLSAPNPAAGHRRPTPPPETPGHSQASLGQSLVGSCGSPLPTPPPQETGKHSSVSVSGGSLGPGAHRVCVSPLRSLVGMGFDSKCDFAPPTILLGLPLCPWTWGISTKLLHCCTAATPAPTVLVGLLCPWMWGISSQSLQHPWKIFNPIFTDGWGCVPSL